MKVCYAQHQEDQAFPNCACNTTSRPDPDHLGLITAMFFWLDFHHVELSLYK